MIKPSQQERCRERQCQRDRQCDERIAGPVNELHEWRKIKAVEAVRQPDIFAVIAQKLENPVNQRRGGAEPQTYRDIKRCGEKVPILKPVERAQADKAK